MAGGHSSQGLGSPSYHGRESKAAPRTGGPDLWAGFASLSSMREVGSWTLSLGSGTGAAADRYCHKNRDKRAWGAWVLGYGKAGARTGHLLVSLSATIS